MEWDVGGEIEMSQAVIKHETVSCGDVGAGTVAIGGRGSLDLASASCIMSIGILPFSICRHMDRISISTFPE
jgi:predicted amidohydrolase